MVIKIILAILSIALIGFLIYEIKNKKREQIIVILVACLAIIFPMFIDSLRYKYPTFAIDNPDDTIEKYLIFILIPTVIYYILYFIKIKLPKTIKLIITIIELLFLGVICLLATLYCIVFIFFGGLMESETVDVNNYKKFDINIKTEFLPNKIDDNDSNIYYYNYQTSIDERFEVYVKTKVDTSSFNEIYDNLKSNSTILLEEKKEYYMYEEGYLYDSKNIIIVVFNQKTLEIEYYILYSQYDDKIIPHNMDESIYDKLKVAVINYYKDKNE